MPRPKIKTDKVEVHMTSTQKKKLSFLANMKKTSMSEYLLESALAANHDFNHEPESLLKKHCKNVESFQKQQQRTMYIIMQFCMYITSASKPQETILKFYENAYKDAIAEFGKEET